MRIVVHPHELIDHSVLLDQVAEELRSGIWRMGGSVIRLSWETRHSINLDPYLQAAYRRGERLADQLGHLAVFMRNRAAAFSEADVGSAEAAETLWHDFYADHPPRTEIDYVGAAAAQVNSHLELGSLAVPDHVHSGFAWSNLVSWNALQMVGGGIQVWGAFGTGAAVAGLLVYSPVGIAVGVVVGVALAAHGLGSMTQGLSEISGKGYGLQTNSSGEFQGWNFGKYVYSLVGADRAYDVVDPIVSAGSLTAGGWAALNTGRRLLQASRQGSKTLPNVKHEQAVRLAKVRATGKPSRMRTGIIKQEIIENRAKIKVRRTVAISTKRLTADGANFGLDAANAGKSASDANKRVFQKRAQQGQQEQRD